MFQQHLTKRIKMNLIKKIIFIQEQFKQKYRDKNLNY